jgi:molecular chaperone DnaK
VLEVGDTQLDGDDWDAVLTEYVADEFEKTQSIDLHKDRQALQRLKEAAEKAKIELSPMLETEVNLPFSTAADAQTAVDILVLHAERPMAADNMTLGKFRLEGLPSAPRGTPQIEVTFDLDAVGIQNATAKDKATGREHKITITASTNLNKAHVERMVQDAQRGASEDNRRQETVQARNEADQAICQAENSLRDLGEKMSAAGSSQA